MGTWTTLQRPWTCCCSTWTSDRPSERVDKCTPCSHTSFTTVPSSPHFQPRGYPRLWWPCPLPVVGLGRCWQFWSACPWGQSQPSLPHPSLHRLPVSIPPSAASGQRLVPPYMACPPPWPMTGFQHRRVEETSRKKKPSGMRLNSFSHHWLLVLYLGPSNWRRHVASSLNSLTWVRNLQKTQGPALHSLGSPELSQPAHHPQPFLGPSQGD